MDSEILAMFSTMVSIITAILVPILLYYIKKINQICSRISAVQAHVKNLNDWLHELKNEIDERYDTLGEKIEKLENRMGEKIHDMDIRLGKIEDLLSRGF